MVDSAFDSAAANQDGTVTSFLPGLIRVGAVINGKTGFASVTVKPQAPARIEIDAPRSALVIGAAIALGARAVVASGDPYWRLSTPGAPSRLRSPRSTQRVSSPRSRRVLRQFARRSDPSVLLRTSA